MANKLTLAKVLLYKSPDLRKLNYLCLQVTEKPLLAHLPQVGWGDNRGYAELRGLMESVRKGVLVGVVNRAFEWGLIDLGERNRVKRAWYGFMDVLWFGLPRWRWLRCCWYACAVRLCGLLWPMVVSRERRLAGLD